MTPAKRPDIIYDPKDAAGERLDDWWMEKARDDANKVIPKAMEYGAFDLELMGGGMLGLMPQLDLNDMGRETAIAFYVLGKIARIISALKDGRVPDIDSWFDIGVYAQIAQYERDGTWPGL